MSKEKTYIINTTYTLDSDYKVTASSEEEAIEKWKANEGEHEQHAEDWSGQATHAVEEELYEVEVTERNW